MYGGCAEEKLLMSCCMRHSISTKLYLALIVASLALMVAASPAAAAELTVDATANIHGAGHAVAPGPGGGGGGSLPPQINIPLASAGSYFIIHADGLVTPNVGNVPVNPADGGNDDNQTNVLPYGGISGIQHGQKSMFLVGVFLNDDEPTDPAPAALPSFTFPDEFTQLNPLLNQVFFVGDGVQESTGAAQRFYIPTGATRLFLGFADAPLHDGLPGAFDDNYGYLDVCYKIAPEPSSLALGLMASVALVWWRRRQSS
jgi:hypothetical protein